MVQILTDPLGTTGPVLLLPYRDPRFELVDDVSAGAESGIAMARADRNRQFTANAPAFRKQSKTHE